MDPGFYRAFRHITPNGFRKWIDRYNYESSELQDMIQTNPAPIQVQTLDLTVAQTTPLLINFPARAFVIYYYDSTTTIKTRKTDAFAKVRINQDRVENEFPAKHNRGYRGDYFRLYLTWEAQANVKADLVMHLFDDDPWEMDGVAVSGGGGGTVTSVAFAEGSNTPIFTITGSPVIGAGTITETLKNQTANTVFAGPTSGAAAQPAFRALVAADLPATGFTQGSVIFAGAAGVLTEDNANFFWDDANNRLGLRRHPANLLDLYNSTDDTFLGSLNIIGMNNNDTVTWAHYVGNSGIYGFYNKNLNGKAFSMSASGHVAMGNSSFGATATVDVLNQTGQTTVPMLNLSLIAAQTSDFINFRASDLTTILAKFDNTGKAFLPNIQLGTAGSATGSALFSGATSGTITVKSAAAAGTWTFTLPTTDGNANEFLQTDGNGVTTWAAASGGSGGIQTFNTAGANNWTVPAGVSRITVSIVGAGGGGAGGGSGVGNDGGGAGGGVSAAPFTANLAVTAGDAFVFTLGAGGTGGTAGNPSTEGGQTSVTQNGTTVLKLRAFTGAANPGGATGGASGGGSVGAPGKGGDPTNAGDNAGVTPNSTVLTNGVYATGGAAATGGGGGAGASSAYGTGGNGGAGAIGTGGNGSNGGPGAGGGGGGGGTVTGGTGGNGGPAYVAISF